MESSTTILSWGAFALPNRTCNQLDLDEINRQDHLRLYVQSSMKFKIYDDTTLRYIFIFIIFNLNNRVDLF